MLKELRGGGNFKYIRIVNGGFSDMWPLLKRWGDLVFPSSTRNSSHIPITAYAYSFFPPLDPLVLDVYGLLNVS